MRDEKKYAPLRKRAKVMFVHEGLSQKEIAKELNVAPKTVSTWCNAYGWKKAVGDTLKAKGTANSLYDFMEFLKENHNSSFQQVEGIYKDYLNNF